MKKNIKGKENMEPVKDTPEMVKQEPVKEEKVAEKHVKSSKDLKQKLLKLSNAKVTHKQQSGPPLANSLQKMPTQKPSHPKRSLLKSATNKIKQNQQKILNASQLLANSRSSQQLLSSVPLTKGQNERLRLYFKYLCELVQSYPKRTTFQDVKNMFETINMTEWMIFCKNMGITERIKGRSQGIRFLSFVFKKYEDIQRRMTFQKFGLAVREVIIEIAGNMKEQTSLNAEGKQNQPQEVTQLTFQMKLKQILDWLNLTDKKKHTKKLKEMGIMCSEEVYTIPKHSQVYTSTERKPVQTQSQNPIRSSLPQSNSSSFHINEGSPSSPASLAPKRQLPKIYRTHLQRKQSKLMHSLAVTNLNKFTPTQDTKDFLEKYIGYDDRYLKQYFHKQDSVKNGVMAKLEARSKGKSRRF